MSKIVETIHKNALEISQEFVSKYYPEGDNDCHPIGSDPMGVYCIADEFWNLEWMITAIELNIDRETLHDWYYSYDDDYNREYNLKNFIKKNTHE